MVKEQHPQVQLEFYLISSGIGDVVRHTPIAQEFTDIWASEFIYDQAGAIQFPKRVRSEEHTSELQSLMRISYAVFCLKKKKTIDHHRYKAYASKSSQT